MNAAPITRRGLPGATAAAGACTLPAVAEAEISGAHADAELFDLIRRHGEAEEVMEGATAASDEAFAALRYVGPRRPDALRHREWDFPRTALGLGLSDPGEGEVRWYGVRAVKWMRDKPAAQWFRSLVPSLGSVCEDRRVEILAAWDSYQVARLEAEVATGYAAAIKAVDAAASLVVDLACEVKRARPRSLCGLRALAGWFGRQAERDDAHDDALELLAATVASFGGVSS